MTRSNSITTSPAKPAKPYPEFPLFPHETGRWAKKIRGKMHYFGKWDDPQGALDKYTAEKDALHAGRRPQEDTSEGETVRDRCNAYWNAKRELLKSGEISPRTFADCGRITDVIIGHFGKDRLLLDVRQEEFAALRNKLAKRLGHVTLGNEIQRIRYVFKWGFDASFLAAPVRSAPASIARRRRPLAWTRPSKTRSCSRPRNFAA